jgi:hypothetical protein
MMTAEPTREISAKRQAADTPAVYQGIRTCQWTNRG